MQESIKMNYLFGYKIIIYNKLFYILINLISMNVDSYLESLKSGKCLSERHLRLLCEYIKDILVEESNVT